MNIYVSKKKIFLSILVLSISCGSAMMFEFSENPEIPYSIDHPVFLPFTLFILCVAALLFKLFSKQAEVSLNREGIRIGKSKPISWGEVKGFSKIAAGGSDSILIHVHNPKRIIDQEKGFFRRKYLQLKAVFHGTPISIFTLPLDISTEELLATLRRFKQMADQRQAQRQATDKFSSLFQ